MRSFSKNLNSPGIVTAALKVFRISTRTIERVSEAPMALRSFLDDKRGSIPLLSLPRIPPRAAIGGAVEHDELLTKCQILKREESF